MMHMYEIRKLEKDGKINTVRTLTAEPKLAKKTFKEYAEENTFTTYETTRKYELS